MSNELSTVKYDTAFGHVELDYDTVKNYLVRGNGDVTDQEVVLFVKMCEAQKLNPFTNEAYLIKYGSTPATMVVGYDSFKRRAEENPNYLGKESGIVVIKGNDVFSKEGTCLYPNETLIGGWCRVWRMRGNEKVKEYKEVSLEEYQQKKDGKPAANWASKPCTMIEKVAVSQALRSAFPKDYEGMYTQEEIDAVALPPAEPDNDYVITQEQRQEMIDFARETFGKIGKTVKESNALLIELIKEEGYDSSYSVTVSSMERIKENIEKIAESMADEAEDEEAVE